MVRHEAGWSGRLKCATTACAWLALLLTGCVAGTRGGPIYPENTKAEGVRYFLPAMYLVVQQTPEGILSTSFEVLADSSQEYYVEPFIILAKQNVDITLNPDGTLQSFKLEQDGTPVSAAVVAAMKDISLKKLDLEQAAAEAKAKAGGKGASERPESRRSNVWVFQVRGRTATRITAVPPAVAVPPQPPSPGGSGASGAVEGKFTITIGGDAGGVPADSKLTVDKDVTQHSYVVTYRGHPFSPEDITSGRVVVRNVKPGKVTVEGGKLHIRADDIEGDDASVEYLGERTAPLKKSF
jgi:hypothetical protein